MIGLRTCYTCYRRGFTLVEVAVAVLISAIIASIAIATVRSATTQIAADFDRGRSAWFLRLDSILSADLRQSADIRVEGDALVIVTRAVHPAFDPDGLTQAVRVEYQIESRSDWGDVWVRSVRPEHQLTNDEPEFHELAPADQVALIVHQGERSIRLGLRSDTADGAGLEPQSGELVTAEFMLISELYDEVRGVP